MDWFWFFFVIEGFDKQKNRGCEVTTIEENYKKQKDPDFKS